jgi:predicted transcriptional regulator
MKSPCEKILWYILPAIRKEFAKIMVHDYKMTQKEVAKKLGISNAAVSQYLSQKRGNIQIFDDDILQEIKNSAKKITQQKKDIILKETCRICEMLKATGQIETVINTPKKI